MSSPAQLTDREIEALLMRWKSRTLDSASQAKRLSDLAGFLAWCGNPVLTNLKRLRHVRLPKAMPKPIDVLGLKDLERIRAAAESIEGWPGSVAHFLVAFLPATGLRRKELRLGYPDDLDTVRWRFGVSHPKGEGSWAVADHAPVLPRQGRPSRTFSRSGPHTRAATHVPGSFRIVT